MLAFVALAIQTAYTSTIHASWINNPNIYVPKSTERHWFDGAKKHTHCLVWIGPDNRIHAQEPEAMNLNGPLVGGFPPGLHPADVRNAYNITLKGAKAICLVDYGHLPTGLTDFNTFSQQFGLPQETSSNPTAATNKVFQVVYEVPGTIPPSNAGNGWDVEEALDIEWSHAMAPNAKIYVVECSSGDLDGCDKIAAALTNVKEVSNSWGADEIFLDLATEKSLDPDYVYPGVVFLASAGDVGGVQQYPSESPNVIGVGGTNLFMNTAGTVVTSETAWADSGGGPSLWQPRPSFQTRVAGVVGAVRGTPDLGAVASDQTEVAVYEAAYGWVEVAGTSVACPVVAGIINTTNTFYSSTLQEENLIYTLLGTSAFRDITQGTAGSFSATAGWDFITGCGAPLNLSRTVVSTIAAPDQASTLTGLFLSGNVASLGSVDSNDYVVKGVPFVGLGSTADVRAHFTFAHAVPANAATATISITAKASTANVVNEIFIYNTVTKNYDLVGTPLLATGMSTFSVTLSATQAPNYVDSTGNVVVLSRALLPQRSYSGGNSAYTYSVDQVQVTYGFFQNS